MARTTENIYYLVQDVLRTIPEPYGEDITDEVCYAIEKNHEWFRRYQNLKAEHKKDVVNNYIGVYTKKITGKESLRQVPARKSTIIKTYTKLR
jgi:hypothetical protein